MRRLLTALVLAVASLLPVLASQSQTPASVWALGGNPRTDFTMDAAGRVTDADGATVTLRAAVPAPSGFGTVATSLPAGEMRGRRITLSAELQTRGAKGGASLWLRVDAEKTMLQLDNGTDRALRGDTEWTRFTVSMPVPASATDLVFGVLLQGGGTVSARSLRLVAGAPMTPGARMDGKAKKVLDAALSLVKANALRSREVDWKTVEPEVRGLAGGAERPSDVYPAIKFLLVKLGDRHSFLMPPAQTTAFRTGGAENPPAEVKALSDLVGYVRVPAYGGADPAAARAYATKVHGGMAATAKTASCGWIVDLRANGGGNMWPMLAGLKPLLGSGKLGTFVGPKGSSHAWIAGAGVDAKPPGSIASLESAWVAVLTGPKTASSGEAVAIAFRGRPNTRAFGLPTAGLSTANRTFSLPDGSMILLTTAVDADRTGRKYGDKVDPDERIEADASAPSESDSTVAAAVKWLKGGCRR
jgi:hypothetical protein